MRLVRGAEMAAIDRQTIEEVGLPGAVLMERAGQQAAERFSAFMSKAGSERGRRVLVLCGPGNNGGDGLVVGRYLREAGWEVHCLLVGGAEKLRGEAALYAKIYTHLYGPPLYWDGRLPLEPFLAEVDWVVDALFGTGLGREVGGLYAELIEKVRLSGKPSLAVDLPSGVDSDCGKVWGCALPALLTVTIGLPKWGLYLEPGRTLAGQVETVDIGFPNSLTRPYDLQLDQLLDRSLAQSLLPPRPRTSYKGTFGTLWVVGGSSYYFGAPLLACEAGQRSGVGLLVLAAPQSVCQRLGTGEWEFMAAPYKGGHLDLSTLKNYPWWPTAENKVASASIESPWPAPSALCVGPGLGRQEETGEAVLELWRKLPQPAVFDADALWFLAKSEPGPAAGPRVLTPHLGEFARLMGVEVAAVLADLPYYAREAARRYGAVVVLKGNPTLISDGERTWLNTSGGPVLAQGGSGDLLAGLISGLLAQKVEPFAAAALGVWQHGAAGDLAAQRLGERGIRASEIASLLPAVFK